MFTRRNEPSPVERYEAMETLLEAIKEFDDKFDEIMMKPGMRRVFSKLRNKVIADKFLKFGQDVYSLRAELMGRMTLMKAKHKIGEPQVQNIPRNPLHEPPLHFNCRSVASDLYESERFMGETRQMFIDRKQKEFLQAEKVKRLARDYGMGPMRFVSMFDELPMKNPCPYWKDKDHRGCKLCDSYYALKTALRERGEDVSRMTEELFPEVTIKVPARILKMKVKPKKKITKKKPTKRKKYAKR